MMVLQRVLDGARGDVVISCGAGDAGFGGEICDAFVAGGMEDVVLDVQNCLSRMGAGMEKMVERMGGFRVMVVVVSKYAMLSEGMVGEVEAAQSEGVKVVPVFFDAAMSQDVTTRIGDGGLVEYMNRVFDPLLEEEEAGRWASVEDEEKRARARVILQLSQETGAVGGNPRSEGRVSFIARLAEGVKSLVEGIERVENTCLAPRVNEETHVVREEVVGKIVEAVLGGGGGGKVVAVTGESGIGKTEAVATVCWDKRVVGAFSRVVWVEVGEHAGVGEVLERVEYVMEDGLGMEEERAEEYCLSAAGAEEGMTAALAELGEEERVLFVLDDVWEEAQFRVLVAGIDLEQHGVMVTTRDEGVVGDGMGNGVEVVRMEVLGSAEERMTVFMRAMESVWRGEGGMPKEEEVREIVEWVGGYVLELGMVGRMMQTAEEVEVVRRVVAKAGEEERKHERKLDEVLGMAFDLVGKVGQWVLRIVGVWRTDEEVPYSVVANMLGMKYKDGGWVEPWEVEEGVSELEERGFVCVFDEGGRGVRGMMAHDLVMDWVRRVVMDEGSVAWKCLLYVLPLAQVPERQLGDSWTTAWGPNSGGEISVEKSVQVGLGDDGDAESARRWVGVTLCNVKREGHVLPPAAAECVFEWTIDALAEEYGERTGDALRVEVSGETLELGASPVEVVDVVRRNPGKTEVVLTGGHRWVTDKEVAVLAKAYPSLLKLDMSRCEKVTDAGLVAVAEHCSDLTELNLNSCSPVTGVGVAAVGNGCPNLTKVTLNGCWNVSDAGLASLISGCPLLTELGLRENEALTDAGLTVLGTGCPLLTTLLLDYCGTLTDAGLAAVVAGRSSLTKLGLGGCRSLTDAGLAVVAQNCPLLTWLSLEWCKLVTDAGLSALASGCTGIVELNLRQCSLITDAGLSDLGTGCVGLAKLALSISPLITDVGLGSVSHAEVSQSY